MTMGWIKEVWRRGRGVDVDAACPVVKGFFFVHSFNGGSIGISASAWAFCQIR